MELISLLMTYQCQNGNKNLRIQSTKCEERSCKAILIAMRQFAIALCVSRLKFNSKKTTLAPNKAALRTTNSWEIFMKASFFLTKMHQTIKIWKTQSHQSKTLSRLEEKNFSSVRLHWQILQAKYYLVIYYSYLLLIK